MKFASICYCKTMDDIRINSIIKRIPKRLLDFYIKKKNPYTCKEVTLLEAEGLEIILPLLQEEEYSQKWDEIVTKTLEELKEKEVEIVISPTKGIFPNNIIKIADGKAIFALLLNPVIDKALKYVQKEKKSSEFLIIDGGNFLTNLILDSIYPNVNFLSIYTDRAENFEQRAKEIYEDTGLILQVFSNCKNALLKEADVIINGGCDMENYDYYFKKKSIYLDVNKNRQKLKRLRQKREDMLFIDGLELKIDNAYYTSEVFEAIEYVKNKEFRNFLSKQYNKEKGEFLRKDLKQYKMGISAFRCNGEIVKSK